MKHEHELAAYASDSESLHRVSPSFVRSQLLSAQDKTKMVGAEIRARLCAGMTEDEARRLALEVFKSHGVYKHWHRPYVRFGSGTVLNFNHPIQSEYRLRDGDPYYLDLGPVWPSTDSSGLEYEGDWGDTFVLGSNAEAEACAQFARTIFEEAREYWSEKKVSGVELYDFIRTRAEVYGYDLAADVFGHRVGDFPHQKYSREGLAKITIVPQDPLWVLEVQLLDRSRRFGAFFEDLLVQNLWQLPLCTTTPSAQ